MQIDIQDVQVYQINQKHIKSVKHGTFLLAQVYELQGITHLPSEPKKVDTKYMYNIGRKVFTK